MWTTEEVVERRLGERGRVWGCEERNARPSRKCANLAMRPAKGETDLVSDWHWVQMTRQSFSERDRVVVVIV